MLGSKLYLDNIITPDKIEGLVAWYDPSNIETLWANAARTTQLLNTDGQSCYAIDDLSGNNNHLLPHETAGVPTLAKAHQNGRNMLYVNNSYLQKLSGVSGLSSFGTALHYFSCIQSGGLTLGNYSSVFNYRYVNNFGLGTNVRFDWAYRINSSNMSVRYYLDNNSYIALGGLSVAAVEGKEFYVERSGNNEIMNLGRSGNFITPVVTTVEGGDGLGLDSWLINNIYLGSASLRNHYVGEIILYNKVLNFGDREIVRKYLNRKWDLNF